METLEIFFVFKKKKLSKIVRELISSKPLDFRTFAIQ